MVGFIFGIIFLIAVVVTGVVLATKKHEDTYLGSDNVGTIVDITKD